MKQMEQIELLISKIRKHISSIDIEEASDISYDDEWMQDDIWDDIYKEDVSSKN